MKIKLISPKMTLRPMDSEFKRKMSPSIALLILAALTPNEHEVYIEDENVGKLNLEDKPDLVGISVNVDTSQRAYEISKHYRKQGIKVVLGGIHVSANPDEALVYADSVCIGEAEELWEQVLADVQTGDLKKKYYNDKPTNLANTPIPKWSLIDKSKYLYTNIIVTSRGCPFRCEFCYNSCEYVHNKFRNRPIESRGIMVNASLVFGFDDDEPTVFDETLNWLVKNKIETMTAHILTPYPGTKIYQRLRSESRIIDHESTHYNTSYAVFSPNKMTQQQLYEGYLKIYEDFYSIKNIIKRIPHDFNQRVPYLLFNFVYRKFGKLASKIASFGLMNYLGKLARRLSYGID